MRGDLRGTGMTLLPLLPLDVWLLDRLPAVRPVPWLAGRLRGMGSVARLATRSASSCASAPASGSRSSETRDCNRASSLVVTVEVAICIELKGVTVVGAEVAESAVRTELV